MRALEPVDTQVLTWTQPKVMQRHFELRAGDDLVGSLTWSGWFTNRAVGHTISREWYFDRHGLWKPRITIEDAGSGVEIAHMTYKWMVQGDIVFGDERRYNWRSSNFWQTRWEMTDPNGLTVYELKLTNQWWRFAAEVHLLPEARTTRELDVLLLTGWYLAYLMKQSSAAAAS
ncbi:MAG TPA: hypothetical protein PK801_07760 [Aggregatilineales bacterium]|nr:hypothetical protein [Chloroflexota bacterium]HOA23490.1 hypothetical protein [Aggregatilineales bacterium]HPV06508.1 hypothetical protein [Aggregatilineales bacterium]HQA68203.1 hypothetical protein [Aggregatilineales bacterium]HQE18683.1 hypothetical protein [Aggregatilineales bacterium]